MKRGMGSGRREVEGKEGSLGRGSLPWAGGYKVGQRKSWGRKTTERWRTGEQSVTIELWRRSGGQRPSHSSRKRWLFLIHPW